MTTRLLQQLLLGAGMTSRALATCACACVVARSHAAMRAMLYVTLARASRAASSSARLCAAPAEARPCPPPTRAVHLHRGARAHATGPARAATLQLHGTCATGTASSARPAWCPRPPCAQAGTSCCGPFRATWRQLARRLAAASAVDRCPVACTRVRALATAGRALRPKWLRKRRQRSLAYRLTPRRSPAQPLRVREPSAPDWRAATATATVTTTAMPPLHPTQPVAAAHLHLHLHLPPAQRLQAAAAVAMAAVVAMATELSSGRVQSASELSSPLWRGTRQRPLSRAAAHAPSRAPCASMHVQHAATPTRSSALTSAVPSRRPSPAGAVA